MLRGNKKAHLMGVPSLDEIGRDPSLTQGLSSRTRAELIARAAAVIAALAALRSQTRDQSNRRGCMATIVCSM